MPKKLSEKYKLLLRSPLNPRPSLPLPKFGEGTNGLPQAWGRLEGAGTFNLAPPKLGGLGGQS